MINCSWPHLVVLASFWSWESVRIVPRRATTLRVTAPRRINSVVWLKVQQTWTFNPQTSALPHGLYERRGRTVSQCVSLLMAFRGRLHWMQKEMELYEKITSTLTWFMTLVFIPITGLHVHLVNSDDYDHAYSHQLHPLIQIQQL